MTLATWFRGEQKDGASCRAVALVCHHVASVRNGPHGAKQMDQPTLYAWLDGTTMEIVEIRRRPAGASSLDDYEPVTRFVNTNREPLDNSSIDESMQRYANQIQGEVWLIRTLAVETIRIIRPTRPREYEVVDE